MRGLYHRLVQQLGTLSGADAAVLLKITSNHFSRAFRQLAGITFRNFRAQVKIGIGAELLCTTMLSIEEIAILLNYSERAAFEKAFKAHQGLTPARFRSLHKS